MVFIKFYRGLFLFLYFLECAKVSNAQQPPIAAIANGSDSNLQEKIFVHTSKDLFVPGETIWFSIYYIDGITYRPLRLSTVAYLDLLDSNGNAVAATKVSLADSLQNGSMFIPANLAPGYYRLRCYTRWMRNFDPADFYERMLIVGGLPLRSDSLLHPRRIAVFPEGGKLIYGIESRIAMRLRDSQGRGVASDGFIVDGTDTIKKFSFLFDGLADLYFTPMPGRVYRVVADTGQQHAEYPLTQILDAGTVMRITNADGDHLKVAIQSTDPGVTSMYLLAQTRGKIRVALPVQILNGTAQLLIDKRSLDDGLTQFTLFRNDKPVNKRLIFYRSRHGFNISANADAAEYGVRKKVIIHINTNQRDSVRNKLSIAVYRVDGNLIANNTDIQSTILIGPEQNSPVGSGASYFRDDGTIDTIGLDLFLLTAVDTASKRDDVMPQHSASEKYAPELNGEQVYVQARDRSTSHPVAGLRSFLSVPGTDSKFWSAVTNNDGIAMFETGALFGSRQFVLQSVDSNAVITLLSSFAPADSLRPGVSFESLNSNSPFIVRQMLYQQVQQSYTPNQPSNSNRQPAMQLPFYFKSDVSYQLNRYTRFRTLEEVMREYIREINVTNVRGSFHLQVYDDLRHGPFQADPLVLLDGVIMTDLDKFMAYDPLKIRTIDIVTKRYYLGDLHYDGIIDCKTYHGDLDEFSLSAKTVIIDVDALQLSRLPQWPGYETPQKTASRMPDFRTLLYWNPSIQNIDFKGKDIEFYTSDAAGRYLVEIEGLSNDGVPSTTRIWFNVKK